MCRTAICGICQHKSWTGCGKHVVEIMDTSPKDGWCTCEPLDEEEAIFIEGHGSYPPKAGQGYRRGSSVSK
ncbi:uncharacterized protein LODBEIA_P02070 [Lodderomyces beijingensis]|uniref:Uncharacterized protein n=1 Tax=Lodderomyces beijingensis TaxID=1775926 RepID=A0ABP0ZCT3_9ASCO